MERTSTGEFLALPPMYTDHDRRLHAANKSVQVLMERMEKAQREAGSPMEMLRENAALQNLVDAKTRELNQTHEELQRAQGQLLHSQKLEAIGQLAAGVAHEINTPVQYVSDNVQFLQDAFARLLKTVRVCAEAMAPDADATASERAQAAVRGARLEWMEKQVPRALDQSLDGLRRVGTIVAAMKAFSHPSDGQKQPVNLSEAIETTVTVARNEWKYVAELVTDFAPDMPPVPCVRDEFNQVILNLVVNAAHAIGEATNNGARGLGRITVRTRSLPDHAEVRVEDTGTGIPEGVRKRVFEPFFTTKPVGRGTGQGLSIAYGVVVEKHGGRIRFETETGKGTAFIIELPWVAAEGHRGAAP